MALSYKNAKIYVNQNKILNRKQYRELRSRSIQANKYLPANPDNFDDWFGEWKGYEDFFRNPKILPERAKPLGNHYYLIDGEVYHHEGEMVHLKKRKHVQGKYFTEIRIDGKRKTIYLGNWKKEEN